MILTDEDFQQIERDTFSGYERYRAIEAAVLAKLAGDVEPVAWRVEVKTKLSDGKVVVGHQLRNGKLSAFDEPLYTAEALAAARLQGQREMQERCASAIESANADREIYIPDCVEIIRALPLGDVK